MHIPKKFFCLPLCLLVLLGVILRPCNALAAPSVTGVSGSIADGSEAIISGIDFGLKPIASPFAYENFESGDSPYRHPSGEITTTENRPNSSYALLANDYAGVGMSRDAVAGSEIFLSAWFYIPEEFHWEETPVDQIKIMRMYNTDSVPGGTANGYPNTHFSIRNLPYKSMMITNEHGYATGASTAYYIPTGASNIIRGQWNRIDWYVKLSSGTGVADGVHRLWIDGKKLADLTDATTLREDRSYEGQIQPLYKDITMPNTMRVPYPEYRPRYDDIYVDNTLSRIELCDSSTWSNPAHCEIQIPSVWSQNSIVFTTNQGSFTSGEQAYLYVVDSMGAVNFNGYPVTIGQQQSDFTPPSSPANLTVL